jgi:carboxypeptidase Q
MVINALTKTHLILAFTAALLPATAGAQVAQESVDLSVVQRIREEGLERSQVPELAQYLTEVIGPRLTGSPGMQRATEWAAGKYREWGLQEVEIEPWGVFGRGWERESYAGRIITPFVQPLHAEPVSWTGSTDGMQRGAAVLFSASNVEELEQYRGRLTGAFVLMQDPLGIEPEFDQWTRRFDVDSLMPQPPSAEPPPARRGFGTPEQRAARRAERAFRSILWFLEDQGAAVLLRPASRQYGILSSVNGNPAGRDVNNPEPMPQLIVSPEQYGLIHRNIENGVPVELEVNVQNNFFDDDLQQYNTMGEIPGSDKADEYVMIGAHFDSWHMGTGATDNGAGSIVMMEAMRILQELNLQPRRTIRIALWSGEEQGLLGSMAWVANHPDEHDQISAYLNVDNGTGKIRGIWDQMNSSAIPVFEQILWPFRDLGVVAVRHGNTGGTDHLAFDAAGIPGFNFIQDPIEYGLRTHHTYIDTYDHLMIDDLKQAAVVVAATAYQLAMRDEMMPRKELTQ